MEIFFTCGQFSYDTGVGKFSINLVPKLMRKHDVTLITSSYKHKIDGLKVCQYDIRSYTPAVKGMSLAMSGTAAVAKLEKSKKPDIVHSQGEILRHDIVSIHGVHRAWIDEVRTEKGALYRLASMAHPATCVALLLERKVLESKYKAVTVDSKQVRDDLLRHYDMNKDEIFVIPHGINMADFHASNARREAIRRKIRRSYGIGNEPVLLFIGKAFFKKGLAEIIGAMSGVPKVKLIVVGDDNPAPFRELARKAGIVNRVIFTGPVPNVSEYYFAADIFVFPTRHEPFGMVITEAMASGLPVITSKEAGATEIMKNGKDAMIMDDPRNVGDLRDKISVLVENDKLRKKITSNGMKTAATTDWEITYKKFEKLYRVIA